MYDADARWREIRDTPSENFRAVTAGQILALASAWHLPKEYACVIRVYDNESGKVSEKAFKRAGSAHNFVNKLEERDVNFTLYNDESLYSSEFAGVDDDESE